MDQASRKSLYEVVWTGGSTGVLKDKAEAQAIYQAKNKEGLTAILVTTTPCMKGGAIEPDLY